MAVSGETPSQRLRILALWIFKDEIANPGPGARFAAHVSQPMGSPLHKHEGFLEVDSESVTLEEGENNRVIPKSEVRDLQVGFDKNFRQFRDSRGPFPPMHFTFGDDQVYIFTRGSRFGYWQGKNAALSEAIAGH